MVNSARCAALVCCLAFQGAFSLGARDFAAWRVGDTADHDVSTPVALDVADTVSTAALKAEAALKIPVIFRVISSITNTMVLKVTAAFAETRANFLAGLQKQYSKTTLDDPAIQSSDFANFVAAFNDQNKKINITAALAREWAQGGTGLSIQTNLIQQLLQAVRRPVRPDNAPDEFGPGEVVRLVPVRSSKEVLTLDTAERRGALVPLSNVTTVTRLRGLFRRDFSTEDQAFARALAMYIHPNAELDTNLTQQACARAVSQISLVNHHYAPGEIIVRRGQVIDAVSQAALMQLNEILPPESVVVRPQNPPARNVWLAAILAVVATVAVMGIWRLLAARKRPVGVPALPAELAPQIAEMLKLAVVQELAVQRRELLQTQQIAAEEVVRLMHRLNELQAPSQERLATYERRIVELEAELTVRTEENRELLKLKIDLLRQQIETERGPRGVNFN